MSTKATFAGLIVVLNLLAAKAWAQSAGTPPAIDEGLVNADAPMSVTIELSLPDQAGFTRAVDALYDPASPTYQHWMTDAELKRWAPSPEVVKRVTAELQQHGLAISSFDPNGFSLRAQGTTSAVQAALQTSIHRFSTAEKTYTANVGPAVLTGGMDRYIKSVSGLKRHTMHPLLERPLNPKTGKPVLSLPLSAPYATGTLASSFTSECFTKPQPFLYTLPGGISPQGAYLGNVYDTGTKSCAFTASQLQEHYGLPAVYAKGWQGEGQTIVIVDAIGYGQISADANAFSDLNGLPRFADGQLKIIYPDGGPNHGEGFDQFWNAEVALDVQWTHAIAPKANIVLALAYESTDYALQSTLSYVISQRLGNVISNSYGDKDQYSDLDAERLTVFDQIAQQAAARGISVNFASGDNGDGGTNSTIRSDEGPSDSSYVTAVGGTSILNKINGQTKETGWGTYYTLVANNGLLTPPLQLGFLLGSGGGESAVFKKPAWQAALPGTGRQTPDIAALADPQTGGVSVLTQQGVQGVSVVGGTSLACPIFSAIWALANQAAGKSLGQAAPQIARMNENEVQDVVPIGSATNVAGAIEAKIGFNLISPADLFNEAPAFPSNFLSALQPLDAQSAIVFSFGTDTSLTVEEGWDNVTGFGVPYGLSFVEGAAGK